MYVYQAVLDLRGDEETAIILQPFTFVDQLFLISPCTYLHIEQLESVDYTSDS